MSDLFLIFEMHQH